MRLGEAIPHVEARAIVEWLTSNNSSSVNSERSTNLRGKCEHRADHSVQAIADRVNITSCRDPTNVRNREEMRKIPSIIFNNDKPDCLLKQCLIHGYESKPLPIGPVFKSNSEFNLKCCCIWCQKEHNCQSTVQGHLGQPETENIVRNSGDGVVRSNCVESLRCAAIGWEIDIDSDREFDTAENSGTSSADKPETAPQKTARSRLRDDYEYLLPLSTSIPPEVDGHQMNQICDLLIDYHQVFS